jgi:hypothetical protein
MCPDDFYDWPLEALFKYIASGDVRSGSAPGGINRPLDAILRRLKGTPGKNFPPKKWREFLDVLVSGGFSGDDGKVSEIRTLIHERLLEYV